VFVSVFEFSAIDLSQWLDADLNAMCHCAVVANETTGQVLKLWKSGFSFNADLNASRNIEANYRDAEGYPGGLSVNQPIVGA